jgi:hypothetical protein
MTLTPTNPRCKPQQPPLLAQHGREGDAYPRGGGRDPCANQNQHPLVAPSSRINGKKARHSRRAGGSGGKSTRSRFKGTLFLNTGQSASTTDVCDLAPKNCWAAPRADQAATHARSRIRFTLLASIVAMPNSVDHAAEMSRRLLPSACSALPRASAACSCAFGTRRRSLPSPSMSNPKGRLPPLNRSRHSRRARHTLKSSLVNRCANDGIRQVGTRHVRYRGDQDRQTL